MSKYHKPTQEGCGKWLTAKANTNPKRPSKNDATKRLKPLLFSSPPLGISRRFSPTFPSTIQNKLCPMKQSKINKFLVNKPKPSYSDSAKLTHSNSTSKVPIITFPMKREISVALNEYEELWGSEEESEEDDNCGHQLEPETTSITTTTCNQSPFLKTTKETDPAANNLLTNNVPLGLEMRFDSCRKSSYHENEDIRPPLSKKFKKIDDDKKNSFKSETFSKREVQLTQWLQGQVEEFCRHSCEMKKTNLIKQILSSVPFHNLSPLKNKTSNSPELSTLFSEWFNQQIEAISGCTNKDEDELPENWKHTPAEICQQRFAFSQWFEETLETFSKRL